MPIRRSVKNVIKNYTDSQVKVREATSNDPWGPSSTLMSEIADLTYNVVAFTEIMQMVWKRINDHGKNWRHVYKALVLLDYIIKTGSDKVGSGSGFSCVGGNGEFVPVVGGFVKKPGWLYMYSFSWPSMGFFCVFVSHKIKCDTKSVSCQAFPSFGILFDSMPGFTLLPGFSCVLGCASMIDTFVKGLGLFGLFMLNISSL